MKSAEMRDSPRRIKEKDNYHVKSIMVSEVNPELSEEEINHNGKTITVDEVNPDKRF